MATLTNTGIVGTSLNAYKSAYGIAYKQALGDDLDTSPQTPQGQLIGIDALNSSQIDDSIVMTFNSLNIFNAAGNLLDAYANLFGIARIPATPSTVTASLTGVPTTAIPAGSRASTTNGDLFEAASEIVLDVGGVGSGIFRSVEVAPIQIDANTLTQIVDVVTGWETIDNPTAGVVGKPRETDLQLRTSYYNKLGQNALSTIDAIQSKVAASPQVVKAIVFENDTDANKTIQNVTLLPHSIAVVVNGGVAADIGKAIAVKTVGANTKGQNPLLQTAVDVPQNGGLTTITLYYYPVEFVTLDINVTIQVYEQTTNVIATIKKRIIEYFDGTFKGCTDTDGSVQFDTSGITIAEPSYQSRLYTPVNSVTGFEVLTLTQEIQGSGTPQAVITPNLNQQLIVTEQSITVGIL